MDIDEYINTQKDNLDRLREETGEGMMECKKALVMSGGDYEKAKENLVSPTKNYARLISYARTK